MIYKFINFFRTELTEGIDSVSNVMLVPISDSVKLPGLVVGEAIRMAIWDGQQDPEIVDVVQNLQTGQLPILRHLEGTTAKDWAAGSQVTAIISAEMLTTFMASFFNVDLLLQANFLPLSGGTMSGQIRQAAAPIVAADLANKGYVDAASGDFLPLSGGLMSGDIDLGGDQRILRLAPPSLQDHATTKKYVDDVQTIASQRLNDDAGVLVTGGTGLAYTATSSFPWIAYADGITVTVRWHATNGKDSTFNLNSIGARQIAGPNGANLPENMLQIAVPTRLTYVASTNKWHVHDYYSVDWEAGDIKHSGRSADHGSWLLCDGRVLNRTTFARLFTAIGTAFGAGDGSTTFAIPDVRGRALIGKDNMGGSSAGRITNSGSGLDGTVLGAAGGLQAQALAVAELPAHHHAVSGNTGNAGAHSHTNSGATKLVEAPSQTASGGIADYAASPGLPDIIRAVDHLAASDHTHTISFDSADTGGATAHLNVQPSIIVNVFIHI